jgi:Fe2+ or Zn2+ uptake regulation protein
MRTEGVQIKAAAWHSISASKLTGQNAAVMSVFEEPGRDATLSEVMVALRHRGLAWAERSTVNRCLDSLCTANLLERAGTVKCSVSGKTVTRYRLPLVQKDLFS